MLEERGQVHHISQSKAVDQLDVVVPDQLGGQLWGQGRVVGLSTYAGVKYLHCGAIELLDLLRVSICEEVIQIVLGR